MQLRYNVSQIEEFLSRRNMRDKNMMRELAPLVQSSQLMQVKKQDEKDAESLLNMCDGLTGSQVRSLIILNTAKCVGDSSKIKFVKLNLKKLHNFKKLHILKKLHISKKLHIFKHVDEGKKIAYLLF